MGNLFSRVELPFDWCLDNNRSATKVERFWKELNSLRPFNLGECATGLNRLKHGRKTMLQVTRDIVMSNRWFFHERRKQIRNWTIDKAREQNELKGCLRYLGRVPPQVAQVKQMLSKRYCVQKISRVSNTHINGARFFFQCGTKLKHFIKSFNISISTASLRSKRSRVQRAWLATVRKFGARAEQSARERMMAPLNWSRSNLHAGRTRKGSSYENLCLPQVSGWSI